MAQYMLSNRQIKEVQRGNLVQIALPAPYDETRFRDLRQWIEKSLPMMDPEWVLDWSEETVLVKVNMQSGDSLGQRIGEIIRHPETIQEDWLVLPVECVIVKLSKGETYQSQYPPQWPSEVF